MDGCIINSLSIFPLKGVDTTLEYQLNYLFLFLKKLKDAGLLGELICEDDFHD